MVYLADLIITQKTQLNKYWEEFQQNHEFIISKKSGNNKDNHYYKNPDQYIADVQEFYYDEIAKLMSAKHAKSPPAARSQHEQSFSTPIIAHENQLPKIPLPKFSGDAKDWISFRDVFNDIVKSNYSDSSKLSYFKDSLKNEPFYLIKNLTFTEGNFEEQVWKKLLDQYDKNCKIIYAHLNTLLNLKPTTSESSKLIRKLINEVTDSTDSLKGLKVQVEHWDCIMYHLL